MYQFVDVPKDIIDINGNNTGNSASSPTISTSLNAGPADLSPYGAGLINTQPQLSPNTLKSMANTLAGYGANGINLKTTNNNNNRLDCLNAALWPSAGLLYSPNSGSSNERWSNGSNDDM